MFGRLGTSDLIGKLYKSQDKEDLKAQSDIAKLQLSAAIDEANKAKVLFSESGWKILVEIMLGIYKTATIEIRKAKTDQERISAIERQKAVLLIFNTVRGKCVSGEYAQKSLDQIMESELTATVGGRRFGRDK